MNKILEFVKVNRFNVISWGLTLLVVIALLGTTIWWTQAGAASPATSSIPTAVPGKNQASSVGLPAPVANMASALGIGREIQLKTNMPDRPRMDPVMYTVKSGDSVAGIAKQFNIKQETILYTNKDTLQDNPHNLKPGMILTIPPVDGLYYKWKDGDTIDAVAAQFKAKADDIINFIGNHIDLTDPQLQPGTLVMIPGGSRQLADWEASLQASVRVNNGSTGTSDFGSNSCGGGAVGTGSFGWPTNGPMTISGNDYGPGHLGIDITAPMATPIFAIDAGVVTMAQGGYNYGYGNVIMIDHRNGYVSVYAHLSQINVTVCESVGKGTLIALSGSTGNSTGPHLHFEIRKGGTNVNPWDFYR
jgi:murein DD-endopeptidase MepM/ murein hydrolase activator NlpD